MPSFVWQQSHRELKYLSRYGSRLQTAEDSEIDSRKHIFLFSIASRPTLEPTLSPIQWVPGLNRQEREADHSPPSNAEDKKAGTIPALPHMSS
jgi:hypothetical protein